MGGMGRISVSYPDLEPQTLREMHVNRHVGNFFDWCPPSTICTKRMTEDANLCNGDEGAPLYQYYEKSYCPKCLLGVGAYFGKTRYSRYLCNGGSFYTSVPDYWHWIQGTIRASELEQQQQQEEYENEEEEEEEEYENKMVENEEYEYEERQNEFDEYENEDDFKGCLFCKRKNSRN